MAEYDNTNKGALFANKQKKSDKSPDYSGSCEIKCPHCGIVTEWRESGWKRTAKSGLAFLSQAFSIKAERPPVPSREDPPDGPDDEVPF